MGKRIRLLWITNMMPGFVAQRLSLKGTNKEGWIEGAAEKLIADSNIKLMLAFPFRVTGKIEYSGNDMEFYGFSEDTNHPENYDIALEKRLDTVIEAANPDVIHVFGTEFPHTLALMKLEKWKSKALIHIQGIMEECEKVYNGGIPEEIVNRKTFRDVIKKDGITDQINKYKLRAANEHVALLQAEYVLGRTSFDKNHIHKLNPDCRYHHVNETLRNIFYSESWNINSCNRHELFLSQGNYPLKGAHDAIKALAKLNESYSDVKLYIAGNKITSMKTLKDKLKLPSYGKYLLELIDEYNLSNDIIFTGPLDEKQMLERYMSCEVFIQTSYVENSPNSLGEAMLLGVPSVATGVGGVSSVATNNQETLMFKPGDCDALCNKIAAYFESDDLKLRISDNARLRAAITYDRDANYKALLNAYYDVIGG